MGMEAGVGVHGMTMWGVRMWGLWTRILPRQGMARARKALRCPVTAMGGLWLLFALLVVAPAGASIREVRAGEDVVVPAGSGLLLLAVDSDQPLPAVRIKRNESMFGVESLRSLPKGTTMRLYVLPAGSYRWDRMRDKETRYTFANDDGDYSFEVAAGIINYPGHLIARVIGESRVLAHVANRGLLAMDWLRQHHPAAAGQYAFTYQGYYPDPFPAFYREHGKPGTHADAKRPPLPVAGTLPLPVDLLWRPVELQSVGISPAGDFVATVERVKKDGAWQWIILLTELATWESRVILNSNVEISRLDWTGNDTLVISCEEKGKMDGLFVLQLRGKGTERAHEMLTIPLRGRLVGLLPGDPQHILFASLYSDGVETGLQVHKIDISSQKAINRERFGRWSALDRTVEEGRTWYADASGTLRAAVAYREEGSVLMHGSPGAFRDVMVLEDDHFFSPMALSADGNLIYGSSDKDRPQRDLVELDPATGKILRTLWSRPGVDVQSAVFDAGHNLIGATYYEDGLLVSDYLDEGAKTRQEMLQRAFPGKTVRVVDRDAASKQFLLVVGGNATPSQIYHFDSLNLRASLFALRQPWLEGKTFRESQVVRTTSQDGLPIEAYLTLPDTVAPPPLVVLAHGGPIGVRDTRYFDPEVQFLASMGYAVLQVNFRGSEGYGRQFREAGKRSYGSLIEDDIDSALTAALAQHPIDRTRMCAMGSSYGGYSALVSAIRWPGRFRCVVSVAGVSDRVLFFTASDSGRDEAGRKALEEAIGNPVEDAEAMRTFSPLYRYRELGDLPILLVHGTEDFRVDYEHSRRLDRMLSEAGHPPGLLTLEGESHDMDGETSQTQVWDAVAGFLRLHLSPAGAVPTAPAMAVAVPVSQNKATAADPEADAASEAAQAAPGEQAPASDR